jgi:uncharacterized protein (TIGR03067 family)
MNALLPRVSLVLLAVGLFAQSQAQSPAPSNFDPQQLLGRWEGFVSSGDGTNPSQRTANFSITIAADKITCNTAGNIGEGTYRIAPGGGHLHHIDCVGTGGIYQGKTYHGIFILDGGTLKWCSGDGGRPRPTILRTNYAGGQYLAVLTRKP